MTYVFSFVFYSVICVCYPFFCLVFFFFFKQKTAYEMRIRDWSSDVCSSDLGAARRRDRAAVDHAAQRRAELGQEHVELALAPAGDFRVAEIGRASCRERVCQYG